MVFRENTTMNHGQIPLKPDKVKRKIPSPWKFDVSVQEWLDARSAGPDFHNVLCHCLPSAFHHELSVQKVSILENSKFQRNCRLGAKNTITIALIINIIGSLLTPFVAIFLRSYYWIAIVRAVMGLGFGIFGPAKIVDSKAFRRYDTSMLPNNLNLVPIIREEYCYGDLHNRYFDWELLNSMLPILGNQMGIALAMFFTAYLSELPWFGGWPFSFIASGTFGIHETIDGWQNRIATQLQLFL